MKTKAMKAVEMEEARKRMDIEMMKVPDRWPHLFVLPLKRYKDGKGVKKTNAGGWPEMASLIADGTFHLYNVNVFDIPKDPDEFRNRKKYEYPTAEEVVADGWMVD